MTDRTPARLGRRALLLAGGGALAAAGLASAAPATAFAAARRHRPRPRPPFDLTRPATALFRAKPLHNNTVLQSFAFDDRNRRLYTVQLMAGGQQLPDEAAPVSGATRAADGDLCLTQLDLAGNETGHMFLKGFGHGVQIGVEPHGSGAYLWTEVDSDNYGGTNGWGRHLGRFRFTDGAVLTASDPRIRQFQLIPGTDHTTVSVNVHEDRLLMRYALAGVFHYALFCLSDVNRGGRSSTLLGRCGVEWALAGVACAGHDDEKVLQQPQYGVEAQAGSGAFGSRRSRVQKACASTARVT